MLTRFEVNCYRLSGLFLDQTLTCNSIGMMNKILNGVVDKYSRIILLDLKTDKTYEILDKSELFSVVHMIQN